MYSLVVTPPFTSRAAQKGACPSSSSDPSFCSFYLLIFSRTIYFSPSPLAPPTCKLPCFLPWTSHNHPCSLQIQNDLFKVKKLSRHILFKTIQRLPVVFRVHSKIFNKVYRALDEAVAISLQTFLYHSCHHHLLIGLLIESIVRMTQEDLKICDILESIKNKTKQSPQIPNQRTFVCYLKLVLIIHIYHKWFSHIFCCLVGYKQLII